jgi:hypothetical protein
MRRYLAFNLVANSEIEIIGALPLSATDDRPSDISIRIDAAVIHTDATASGPYRLHGNQLLFDAPNVGRFLCVGGKEITVAPALDADPKWLAGLLVATALPALMWQRGGFVLHAGAVVLPRHKGAIALAGPSCVGKSTTIAQLVHRNACVVGDDTLNLELTANGIHVSGLPSAYFTGAANGPDRMAVAVAQDQTVGNAPVAAIIVLQRVDTLDGPSITRLKGADAIQALLKNRHRPLVPAFLGLDQKILQFCALLCATTPVYVWARKQGALEISDAEFAAFDKIAKVGK